MISNETIKEAVKLFEEGYNLSEISRRLNISRSAIRDNINQKVKTRSLKNRTVDDMFIDTENKKHYSYILGLYYGDGCLSKFPRTYRLRIFLGRHEEDTIKMAMEALGKLFPSNKASVYQLNDSKCDVVSLYSKDLINIFPDHDIGKKHSRKIFLSEWQEKIIEENPEFFITGLYDADGSGYYDNGYLKYNFINTSRDIFNMFEKYCDVDFGSFKRIRNNPNHKNVLVARVQKKEYTLAFQETINSVYRFYGVEEDLRQYKI